MGNVSTGCGRIEWNGETNLMIVVATGEVLENFDDRCWRNASWQEMLETFDFIAGKWLASH